MCRRIYLSSVAAGAVIIAGLFAGCEKSDSNSSSSQPPAGTPTSMPAATPVSDAIKDAATTGANSSVPAVTKPSADASAPPAGTGSATPEAANPQAADKASGLITQATQYIKDNKLDLAEKALNELDGMKPQLSAAYQTKIDSLHSMFETMKKGGDLKDTVKNGLLGK